MLLGLSCSVGYADGVDPGVKLQGGGLFTAPPATVILTDSVIALNIPDQCVGC